MTTASGAPDTGNILDNIFKNPFENLVHAGESWLSTEAASLFETAKAQAAQAAATQQQALEASLQPAVTAAATGIAEKVPVIGPLIAGEAGAVANEGTDAIIDGIINFLQGKKTIT